MKFLLLVLVLCKCTAEERLLPNKNDDMNSLFVQSIIQYRFAHTLVRRRMGNSADRPQQVIFSMVLPENAYVSNFSMNVNGETYSSRVMEKERAEVDFKLQNITTRPSGLNARDANRFTVSVEVKPHRLVTFNLEYEELLSMKEGKYKHVVYLDPGQILEHLKVEVYIVEPNIKHLNVPAIRTTNAINGSHGGRNLLAEIQHINLHRAAVKFAPNMKQQQELNNDGVKGQFIVEYQISRKLKNSSQFLVNGNYFAHYFAPEHQKHIPKHITFALDISHSMKGEKFEHMMEAMDDILEDLRSDDYFSIVIFQSSVQVWSSHNGSHWIDVEDSFQSLSVLPVTEDNVEKAKIAIHNLQCCGDRDIYKALATSMQLVKAGKHMKTKASANERKRQLIKIAPMIMLITDGKPTAGETNVHKIIRDIRGSNLGWDACVISLALGGEVDMDFLNKLSLSNYGFAQRIYIASDMSLQIKQSYRQVATPLLTNVTFTYKPKKEVKSSSLTKHNLVTIFFFSGTEAVVAGRMSHVSSGNELSCEVTGYSFDGVLHFKSEEPHFMANRKNGINFMERLWANLGIKQLLIEEMKYYGKNSVSRKQEVIDVALKYSLLTPVTSLIVKYPDRKEFRVDMERADEALWNVCRGAEQTEASTSSIIPAFSLIHLLYFLVIKMS